MRKMRADAIGQSKAAKEPDTPKRQASAQFGAGGKELAVERRARWAHLRHLLTEAWVNGRPFRSTVAIREALRTRTGLEATESTIERDLNALGCIRVTPEGEAPAQAFYIIPPYVPEAEDMRASMSADVLAIETEHRIAAYVVEMFPWKEFVIINTDRNCGQMVADILALNPWPEMVHVQAGGHSILILCTNAVAAEHVWLRLNRQYEDIPRYKAVAGRVRRRSSGSFLDYFYNPEITKHEEGE